MNPASEAKNDDLRQNALGTLDAIARERFGKSLMEIVAAEHPSLQQALYGDARRKLNDEIERRFDDAKADIVFSAMREFAADAPDGKVSDWLYWAPFSRCEDREESQPLKFVWAGYLQWCLEKYLRPLDLPSFVRSFENDNPGKFPVADGRFCGLAFIPY